MTLSGIEDQGLTAAWGAGAVKTALQLVMYAASLCELYDGCVQHGDLAAAWLLHCLLQALRFVKTDIL